MLLHTISSTRVSFQPYYGNAVLWLQQLLQHVHASVLHEAPVRQTLEWQAGPSEHGDEVSHGRRMDDGTFWQVGSIVYVY